MALITALTTRAGHHSNEGSARVDTRHAVMDLPFLGERERLVLSARLGLDRGTPRTLSDTARMVHLGRDAVARVESLVACKLRHPSASSWEPQVSRLLAAIESLP